MHVGDFLTALVPYCTCSPARENKRASYLNLLASPARETSMHALPRIDMSHDIHVAMRYDTNSYSPTADRLVQMQIHAAIHREHIYNSAKRTCSVRCLTALACWLNSHQYALPKLRSVTLITPSPFAQSAPDALNLLELTYYPNRVLSFYTRRSIYAHHVTGTDTARSACGGNVT